MDNNLTCGKTRLEEAIRRYECSCYTTLPQSDEPIPYSARYRRHIRRLGRNQRASFTFPIPVISKYAAAVLLTVILAFTSIFSVSAARITVAEWFVNIYESFTEIFSSDRDIARAPDSIETVYTPTKLPSGYAFKENYLSRSESKLTWENAKGECIFFIQTPLYSKTTVDNEDTEHETFLINDTRCFLTQKNGKTCVYWNSKEYSFSLIVPKELTREEYTEIIASVTERKQS